MRAYIFCNIKIFSVVPHNFHVEISVEVVDNFLYQKLWPILWKAKNMGIPSQPVEVSLSPPGSRSRGSQLQLP